MLNFNSSIANFLFLIENSINGKSVKFSINYQDKNILIVESNSGFLRKLYNNEKVCAHLTRDGIVVTFFS